MKSFVQSVVLKGIRMPTCEKCGYQNREENQYCVNCGSPLQLTEEETQRIKTREKTYTSRWAAYFFIFFGFSMLFGGLITWLTSVGTIIESISRSTSLPYIVIGLILMLVGLIIYSSNAT